MISATDGYVVGKTGAWKSRHHIADVSRCMALLSLLCFVILPVDVAPGGLGGSGAFTPPMMSTARVVANQAVAIVDGPAPPVAEAQPGSSSAAANRPVELKADIAEDDEEAFAVDPPVAVSDSSDALQEEPPRDALPESGQSPVSGKSSRDLASLIPSADVFLASMAQPDGTPHSALSTQQEKDEASRARRDRGEDPIVASVSIASDQAQRITIAKNATAMIELKLAIDRAEIANPEVADLVMVEPKRVVISGVGYGTTQLLLWIGEEQRVFNVSVEMDLAMLHDLIKSVAPTSAVQARSISGMLVLRGSVPDVETAEQIIQLATLLQGGEVQNQLRVAGVQQTMLRVVVAEVNRRAMRELGVNWAIGGSDLSRDFFFANNVGQVNPTIFSSSGLTNVLSPNNLGGQMTYSVAAVGNGTGTNVTFGFPRAEFQMFLNALRENGLSRTLAEPNLVAISGQTATFLAGGEVPIPVAQGGAAAGAITIDYREFGVRLAFTPTVVAGQIIRLHVMSEVSEAIPGQQIAGGFPIFTFNTRRVESTIECGNGQTFAIAGLLNDQVRAVASKIPGLGDIPVLGALFSSTQYQRSNTEMVVLVTPQLVEPLDPQQVPAPPGSLMTEPTDFEFYALPKLEGKPVELPESDGVPREHVPVNVRMGGTTDWTTSQLALRGPWGLAEFSESN